MTDDQHGESAPAAGRQGGWEPLPQGDYDDGATAFVQLPEGGIDALLAAADSPLAAPGHGYVPPQIAATPRTARHRTRAATGRAGAWAMPAGGAQWPDPNAGQPQPPTQRRVHVQPGLDRAVDLRGAGRAGRCRSRPRVTGEWSIPVAGGDLPDESGEFSTSALVEQWGGKRRPPRSPAARRALGDRADRHGVERAGPRPGPTSDRGDGTGPRHGPEHDRTRRPEERAAAEPTCRARRAAGTWPRMPPEEPSGGAAAGRPYADPAPPRPTAGQAPEAAQEPAGPIGEADAEAERPRTARGAGDVAPRGHSETSGAADGSPGPTPTGDPASADEPAPVPPPHEEHPLASYVLRVNGTDRPVTDAWIGESLLYVLRERLGLAGAKDGCSQGECGACNVQVDGRLVASCLVPGVTAAGSEVRTVEGLAADGQPSDVQRALARCGAVQCGFCVPGMAMTVHDLLEGNPAPTELETRQALCGNLCRCSGYRGVLEAVRDVVAEREAHGRGGRPSRTATRHASRTRRARAPAASTRRRTSTPAHPAPARPQRVRPGRRPGVSNEAATATTAAEAAPPPSRSRTASACPCRPPTPAPRPRAPSRTRPTCGPRACCGPPCCAPRTRTRASCPSTPSHAREMPGVRAVVTHEDVPGSPAARPRQGRPARCSPPRSYATTASPSRPSPPTTPTPRGWPPPPSSSSTRCSTR